MLTKVNRARAFGLLSLFRLKPFDVATDDGRSKERLRRIFLTATTSATARLVMMAAPLVTIPLTVNYLGQEKYGLWMTVTSVFALMVFADLGLGNGLLTAVGQGSGRDDILGMRRAISSGFFMLVGVALALVVLFLLLRSRLPWRQILNLQSETLATEASAAVLAASLTFAVNLPLSVVQRVQMGLQEGFQSNIWQCTASLAGMVAVIAAVKATASLPILILCAMGTPCVMALLNSVVFFGWQRPDLRPTWTDFSSRTSQMLLRTGALYLILSAVLAASFASDNLILAHTLGYEAVSKYSIPARLAAIVSSIPMMLLTPLWPANAEALARGDVAWVRRNTRRMAWLAFAVAIFGAGCFIALTKVAVQIWIGAALVPSTWLLVALGISSVVMALAGPYFMVLNGACDVGPQIVILGLYSALALGLKVFLVTRVGLSGVAWGTCLPYAFIVVPLAMGRARTVLRRAAPYCTGGGSPYSENLRTAL